MKPLIRLIDRIREMNAGEAEVGVRAGPRDEFGDLAEAFNVMNQRLISTSAQLDRAKREHDGLLSRLLPASVASRLLAGQPPPAERFDDASVLFAEVSGLTEITASLPPQAAVALLGDLIAGFDDAAQRHGVEATHPRRLVPGGVRVAGAAP